GCTGGQHRSVVLAEETADYLKACGYRVSIAHRDLSRASTAGGAAPATPAPPVSDTPAAIPAPQDAAQPS
ncbi:MAG: hypothetical protein IKD70_09095, partial [Eggerthellaceae bacterium]|nr:hypothetical protein [Eggerthellaceae bacterium]